MIPQPEGWLDTALLPLLKMAGKPNIERLLFVCQKLASMFPAFQYRHFSISPPHSSAHLVHGPVDEELLPGDQLREFHPTLPGEILNDRFKKIAKLGFGAGPTVWLAENLKL